MIRVSIVEDNKEFREILEENINDEPGLFCLSSYGNGGKALGGIISLDEKPEVVIMDIGLPDMSGIECMEQLKSLYPEIMVLMYTVFSLDEKVFEALKSGADGYILKRDPFEDIANAIKEILKGGAPMSRDIAKKVRNSFRRNNKNTSKVLEKLSTREIEVLELIAEGLSYRKVGEELGITDGTVRQHNHKIFKKLRVNNRIAAINLFNKAIKNNRK